MPISDKQRARLEAIAKERGLDIDELLAQAEEIVAARGEKAKPTGVEPDKPPASPTAAAEPVAEAAKLFQYHLPFVTVNEVREHWLGLEPWDDSKGGSENAAAFAAKQVAPSSSPAGATSGGE